MDYFNFVDYIVFGSLLLVSAFVGIYYAMFAKDKQDNTAQYLFGGKTIGVFPISMSLISSFISGIFLLGIPAEMYVYGSMFWLTIIPEALIVLVMSYIYLPVFYNLQISSSYEYLNKRFGVNVRTLGSCLFVLKMILYIPLVIYVPALAFSQVTGFKLHTITPIVCGICIFYTTLGGLKAVVWTDTIQTLVMVGAMSVVIAIGTYEVGFNNIIKRNLDTSRLEFFVFDLDPTVRNTFWTLVVGKLFLHTASCTVNQAMVQRCLAMPTRKKANLSLIIFGAGLAILISMCCYTGLMIYAHFHDCDPLMSKKIQKADQILPYYILEIGTRIPGLSGVFISGVFSAALSTMSTGLNSLAGIIFYDLIKPFIKEDISEAKSSFIMKIIVVVIGAFCTILVFIVEHIGSLLIQVSLGLSGITAGPLLGLFTLGMFFPWANSKGAITGTLVSIASIAYISALGQIAHARKYIIFPTKSFSIDGCMDGTNITIAKPTVFINEKNVLFIYKIAVLWYTLIGVFIVLVVGMLVSYLTGMSDTKNIHKDLLTPVIHGFLPERENMVTKTEWEINEIIASDRCVS